MHEAAPAKVNLYLHVLGRRGDGYHLLDSLAVFGPAMDQLTLVDSQAPLALEVAGAFAAGLQGEADNLALRAARALAAAAGVAPRGALLLDKRLPVASGIGGGSADAAAALRLLNRAWGLGWTPGQLLPVGAALGADVPVCIESLAARMGGVGNVIAPAPRLPPVWLLLVNPGVALATPAVFAARSGDFSPPAQLPDSWPDAAAMATDLRACGNDLERAAASLCPPIAGVLAAIAGQPGCLLARMSGSGATCFGLFARLAHAQAAAAAMPAAWWASAGPLYEARA
ncbi:MAG: 4-(cytidine 5'-diphospho)-2-C-methyl-D-erythritol kinase [Rubritepida sp.]|nr:4-(cytidine 5'-diphospho)-2-C-methyl-D-erythritol kinase [Rubritepida sp.]